MTLTEHQKQLLEVTKALNDKVLEYRILCIKLELIQEEKPEQIEKLLLLRDAFQKNLEDLTLINNTLLKLNQPSDDIPVSE